MIYHLGKSTLRDRLIDRVVAHEEDIVYGSHCLEERALVSEDG